MKLRILLTKFYFS